MSFSEAQVHSLQRNVPRKNLRTRVRDGRELAYIEGWYAIHVANKIFGFDGWDRETIEIRCVLAREARGSYYVAYAARVRVSVRVGDRVVVRDGHGTGESRGGSPGEAHDFALKGAETDATKRALATFGNAFGLSLYFNRKAKTSGDQSTAHASSKATNVAPNGTDERRPLKREDHKDIRYASSAAATTPSPTFSEPGQTTYDREPAVPKPFPATGSQGGIDKSSLPLSEPRRSRDKAHLRYVMAQPCLLCSHRPSDAHHLKFAQPRALSRKVGDQFTVPLCRAHHRLLHHSGNEISWWHDMGIDPIIIAEQLWKETSGSRTS